MATAVMIAVIAEPATDSDARKRAAQLAAELALPLLARDSEVAADAGQVEVLLVAEAQRLSLRVVGGDDRELQGGKAMTVDLLKLDVRSGAGRRSGQPLTRAIGLGRRRRRGGGQKEGQDERSAKPLHVLDVTAGLGEDTWLMAAMGSRVSAVERSPIVAALLRDGLARAAMVEPQIAQRITLKMAQGREVLADRSVVADVDVVYLDPMFPAGRRAAERKPMRVLRKVVGEDEDAGALLEAARATGVHRVVVKRALRAAPLGGDQPTIAHKGRAMRYDVYIAV